MKDRPPALGIFDSGVGGLSVLKAIRRELPGVPVIYLADQAHVPYGPRPMEEVRALSEGITRFLIAQGASLVVVACNTASAAALRTLRDHFHETAFVGMEPAVKPAAETTHSGVVGVLATPATFQGMLYHSVVARFARGVTVLNDTCPGLVNQIEAGDLMGEQTRAILAQALFPMLEQGIDTVVLGCTHYPFAIPAIRSVVAEYFRTYGNEREIRIIDPAPAVARQAARLWKEPSQPAAAVDFYTTGQPTAFEALLPRLLGETHPVWQGSWDGFELSSDHNR